MRTAPLTLADLRGVFPVPPLARRTAAHDNKHRRIAARDEDVTRPEARDSDAGRAAAPGSIDFAENERLVSHMAAGGITRFLYGGNAFLYHITLAEYAALLDWLRGFSGEHLAIPSAGPSYGRAMDQAALLRKHTFPCVMMLPCGDPRDAAGLERGLREISAAAETPLICYVKDESNFGSDKEAGLDVLGRLVADGVCVAIKYAIVRPDPAKDAYLETLLQRVDRSRVISGIGERPAITHLREFKLPGFTTGSGCLAPALSNAIFEACAHGDWAAAEAIRAEFLPLEDLRDLWGPSKVLHFATELAGVAATGPVLPFLSPLAASQIERLRPVAQALVARNAQGISVPAEATASHR